MNFPVNSLSQSTTESNNITHMASLAWHKKKYPRPPTEKIPIMYLSSQLEDVFAHVEEQANRLELGYEAYNSDLTRDGML